MRRQRIVAPACVRSLRLGLHQVADGVMRDPAALGGSWPHLDGAHPARLGQRNIGHRAPPLILAHCRHRVGLRLQDQVGLPIRLGELPGAFIGPRLGRRHVLGVAERRAFIDPANDGRDLIVAQRAVVLKLLDAYRLVEMPGRHLVRHHAFLDRLGPRARLLVGHQRHRRHGSLAMTAFALLLKNRRDVFRERDGLRCGAGGFGRLGGRQEARNRQQCASREKAGRNGTSQFARIHGSLLSRQSY